MSKIRNVLKCRTVSERARAIRVITGKVLDFTHPERGSAFLSHHSDGIPTAPILLQHLSACARCLSGAIYGNNSTPKRHITTYLEILDEAQYHVNDAIQRQKPLRRSIATRLIGSYDQFLSRQSEFPTSVTCSSEYMQLCVCVIALWP